MAGVWSVSPTALSPGLGHSRCARVGGAGVLSGSPCRPQAFFTERYLQEHPEALEKIEKLKDLIAWQVNVRAQPHGAAVGGKPSLGPDPSGRLSTHAGRHRDLWASAGGHMVVFVPGNPSAAPTDSTPGCSQDFEHPESSLLQMSLVFSHLLIHSASAGNCLVLTDRTDSRGRVRTARLGAQLRLSRDRHSGMQ